MLSDETRPPVGRADTLPNLLTATLLAALAALPATAGERLTLSQMDVVTAGGPEAVARANAWATGQHAQSMSMTDTTVGRTTMAEVTTERAKNGLVVATNHGAREVEYAYATAAARASGSAPTANCQSDIRLSAPATMQMVDRHQITQPNLQACRCTTFGMAMLPK